MEYRVDQVGKISGVRRTPQGGLDVPANLTRAGVFTYHQPDGTVQRELRPANEVFNPASLETLRGAPLTVGHPGLVRADTWRTVSVGHVRDDVAAKDPFVAARCLVQEQDAVKAVESRALQELSCGYTCDVERTPGELNGEKYDAIQRNIRYNHVSLLPAGAGRAGSEVKLRMDGKDCAVARYPETMETNETASLDQLQGQLDAALARADEAEKKLAEVDVDKLVAARLALIEDARKVCGDVKFDGKSDADVMRAAIAKAHPTLKLDDKSDEYLRGVFQVTVDGVRKGEARVAQTNVRADANAATDKVGQSRDRMAKKNADAWKGSRKVK